MGAELPVARVAVLELEAEIRGDLPGLLEERRGADLREGNHFAVVAEILLRELRVAVDAESAHSEPLEVAREEVRQVEGPRLRVRERREGARAGENLITVRARQPLHAFLPQHLIQPAAGAAIAVGDEDAGVFA